MTNSRRVTTGSMIGWAASSPSASSRRTAEGGSTGKLREDRGNHRQCIDLHVRLNLEVALFGGGLEQLPQTVTPTSMGVTFCFGFTYALLRASGACAVWGRPIGSSWTNHSGMVRPQLELFRV